jgi:signal transduction histidine kinase
MERKRKNKGKPISISGYLWRNYIFIIVAATLLIIIPYLVLGLLSHIFQGSVKSNQYTATSIMADSIEDIDIKGVIDNKGGVDVITEDLSVIHLGGINTIPITRFTMEQFTKFLMATENGHSDYHRDIEYNDNKGFWLVVTFPVSLKLEIIVQYNNISNDFSFYLMLVATTFAGYGLLVLCSTILYARYTAKSFVKPMRVLQNFTKKIEEGGYENIEESNSQFHIKEFTQFKEALNHMASELKNQREISAKMSEDRKQMVRDISHDLKNPLASIRGYAELYLNHRELDQSQRDSYVDIIYRNSVRANELIVSLFQYSQVDSADFVLNKDNVDICELVRVKLVEFLPALEEQNLTVEADISEEEIMLSIDKQQMNRVLDNLLGNIVKYHSNATQVVMKVYWEENNVKIVCADNGIGMAEDTAARCFDPFARADEVRNSKTGGSGLGLAIAKKIVEAHGGEISVVTKRGKGCTFYIELPGEI